MSGGMGTNRGHGPPLADRAASAGMRRQQEEGSSGAPGGVHGATHCWVIDPPESPGRWPGLLLRWCRTASGQWRGQVAYAYLRGSEVVLVEAWLDAALLRRR